jgi:hypothetical protein
MSHNKYQTVFWPALILILVGVLLLPTRTPALAQGGLPPRTPPPSGGGGGGKGGSDGDRGESPGAYVELHIQDAAADLWTVLQWRDGAGNWRDVRQWQGTLDVNGRKRWWVAAKDFGSGPFRWVVTRGPAGPVVAASSPFNLPVEAYETVRVEGTLGGGNPTPGKLTLHPIEPTPGPALPAAAPEPPGGRATIAEMPTTGGSFTLRLGPNDLLLGWLGGVLLVAMAVGTWAAWRWFIKLISRIT